MKQRPVIFGNPLRRAALCGLILTIFSSPVFAAGISDPDPSPQAVPTVPAEVERCVDQPHSFKKITCLKDYFRGLTREKSARYAIAQAQALVASNSIDDCHHIAHIVGKTTIVEQNYDLKRSLESCPLDCIQGCIHGVVQGYVAHELERKGNIKTQLHQVCDPASDDPLLRRQCVHGVGHGLLTHGKMPLTEAIQRCRQFDGEDRDTCWGGLFMEHMHHTLTWNEQTLRQRLPHLCKDVDRMNDEALVQFCYDAVGEGLMFYTGHDLKKSLSLCDLAATEGRRRKICQQAAIAEAWNAPAAIDLSVCPSLSGENQKLCVNLRDRLAVGKDQSHKGQP